MIPRRYLIGFTLIEMVVVIVVLGILIAVGANFITLPLKAHDAIRIRSELIDEADSVLTLMVREIREGAIKTSDTVDKDVKFDIVNGAVTNQYRYVCETHFLNRYEKLGTQAETSSQLASHVTSCTFTRDGKWISLRLTLSRDSEILEVFRQVPASSG